VLTELADTLDAELALDADRELAETEDADDTETEDADDADVAVLAELAELTETELAETELAETELAELTETEDSDELAELLDTELADTELVEDDAVLEDSELVLLDELEIPAPTSVGTSAASPSPMMIGRPPLADLAHTA